MSCEGPITLSEIKSVIKNAKNNKSPGCDGIPWEFYKIFYNNISIFLRRSLNDAFANKNLSISQKQGIITCLPIVLGLFLRRGQILINKYSSQNTTWLHISGKVVL